jgi:hypothetical protein
MTDRIFALTVVLEKDVRVDDVQGLVKAISILRGVLSVKEHISDPSTLMAEERAKECSRGYQGGCEGGGVK